MFTTPERSRVTPEREPKTSIMTVAELPTKIEVTLTEETDDGPPLRAAQKSNAIRNKIATAPKRAMTPRRGWRTKTSAARAMIMRPRTRSVHRTGIVSEPRLIGADATLRGLKEREECAPDWVPKPKTKNVKRPTT